LFDGDPLSFNGDIPPQQAQHQGDVLLPRVECGADLPHTVYINEHHLHVQQPIASVGPPAAALMRIPDQLQQQHHQEQQAPTIGVPGVAPPVPAVTSVIEGNGETILAREMAKLSMSERETILNDIHGVADDDVKETPVLVSTKLSELEAMIRQLRHNSSGNSEFGAGGRIGAAYTVAEAISPEYVQDSSFRLMFLRASHFDVEQAAKRLLGHFEKKLEFFGPTKLCKTITLDDLDSDDMECLTSGQSQLLPYRDRSGRAVFFQALSHYQYRQVINAVSIPQSLEPNKCSIGIVLFLRPALACIFDSYFPHSASSFSCPCNILYSYLRCVWCIIF
jgi:hypothetical protein